jgi:hypothetical protein
MILVYQFLFPRDSPQIRLFAIARKGTKKEHSRRTTLESRPLSGRIFVKSISEARGMYPQADEYLHD